MKRAAVVTGRALRSFYDDQMTHHAAALTYYALMSLFPAVLLALSLLGLLGQYPADLRRDRRLPARRRAGLGGRSAGQLAARRAAEQGHGGDRPGVQRRGRPLRNDRRAGGGPARAQRRLRAGRPGRSFLRRKTIDVLSTLVLMALVLASLVMVFLGGGFADDLLGFVGLG